MRCPIPACTLALVLAFAPAAMAQSVPSGAVEPATVAAQKAGDRSYNIGMFYEGSWRWVEKNVAASNPRWAITNAFKGGYGSMAYEHVSRAYFVRQPFTNLRVYDVATRKSTYHCNLLYRSINGCRN